MIRKALNTPKEVPYVVTSAEKSTGIEELRRLIADALGA